MKLASKLAVGALTLSVGAISLGFGLAEDTVDFSAVPAKGLRFKATETSKGEIKGSMVVQDNESEMTQTISRKSVFTQTYTDVADNRVKKIHRSYEDVVQKFVIENEQMPEPMENEMESPLGWKEIRAEFDEEDGVKLEVKDGDEWGDADDKVKKRLPRIKLLYPVIPLPKGTKRVGESWDMKEKEIKKFFADMQGPDEDAEVEVEGSGKLTLTEIKDVKDYGRCAVITAKFGLKMTIAEGPAPEMNMTGTALYSLEHKIVVHMKSLAKMKIEGEMDQMGMTIEMNMGGDMKGEYKVKILPTDG